MIINYDQAIAINHNPDWPYIPDHPYKILILMVQNQEKLICYGT